MSTELIQARRLTACYLQDAIAIETLSERCDLDGRHPLRAVDETHQVAVAARQDDLGEIIKSKEIDQYVAEFRGRIVGAATLKFLFTQQGQKGFSHNWLIDPDFQDDPCRLVETSIWTAMDGWCADNGVAFTKDTTDADIRAWRKLWDMPVALRHAALRIELPEL